MTHYAAFHQGVCIGARSSESRTYTHAVAQQHEDGRLAVVSWHGSEPLAHAAGRTHVTRMRGWCLRRGLPALAACIVVTVAITARRRKEGDPL